MGEPTSGAVRRRHVLYLSGFDPQGPGHYHALYREQAAKQAAVSGYDIRVGPRRKLGANAAWDIEWREARTAGTAVHTTYEFLRWDDIVRANWPRGQWQLIKVTLESTWRLIRNGSLWRILQTSWPAFLALSLPCALLLGLVAATTVLAWSTWAIAVATRSAWLPVAVLGIGSCFLVVGSRWAQAKVQMAWLMRSTSVVLLQARGEIPALEDRLYEFAQRLRQVVSEPGLDEILVVGHSSGSMLAVSVVARAIELVPQLLSGRVSLSLLTLGECIPLLSYQPEATAFRRELATLRQASELRWLDVTAPPDGCCFALVDPTEVCNDGLPTEARTEGGPKRLSPQFAECFSAASYRLVRADKHRCHFQYLMAVEVADRWDYFVVTAGSLGLLDRFAQRPGVVTFSLFQCLGGPHR